MADACVFPRPMFGPPAPLPMYARDVAERRGAAVHRHSWTEAPPDEFGPSLIGWVRGQVTPVLERVGGQPLMIGKSLGSLSAVVAAERKLPGVWLTPLLAFPWARDALAAATAPFLLIGGTAPRCEPGSANGSRPG